MTDSAQILHRYELILSSAVDGIYGLDIDGRITFVNPAALKMNGWGLSKKHLVNWGICSTIIAKKMVSIIRVMSARFMPP
ncbi:PAS domain-containing protein [Bathymodiolus japonicus methanotrophic gill symbiont]|uniref:PAS domain-containing protein n=1 Tax=Bathymodiolus japonicus methanotrophic gill symbiont TaxID=113269 RepID=UPI001C8D46B9|nr:PAS domain-containing protein [Bathymodiolus japonicus methanotrophic gill symbiont]